MIRKRSLVYLVCILLFMVSVLVKQRQISYKRNKPIISSFSQWQEKGRPVFVKKVLRENIGIFEKFTLSSKGAGVFEAYVPQGVRDKLAVRQGIYAGPSRAHKIGSVAEIGSGIEFETGMFRVRADINEDLFKGPRQVVYVNTGILYDAICLPDEIIDWQGDKKYVWKAEDMRAVRQEVKIGRHNGYGVIIEDGLKQGDLVVYNGFTGLSENDLVNIVKYVDIPGEGK